MLGEARDSRKLHPRSVSELLVVAVSGGAFPGFCRYLKVSFDTCDGPGTKSLRFQARRRAVDKCFVVTWG